MEKEIEELKNFLKEHPNKTLKLDYYDPEAEVRLVFSVNDTCEGRSGYNTIGLVPVINNEVQPKASKDKCYHLTKDGSSDLFKTDDLAKLIEENPDIQGFEIMFYINENDEVIFQRPEDDTDVVYDYGVIPFAFIEVLPENVEDEDENTLTISMEDCWIL